MKAVLERIETSDQGTFGRITIEGVSFFTGELPWRENRSDVSCIPAGTYKCILTMSARFKRKLFLVIPVEGRAGIRIHSANRMGDTSKGYVAELNGCISLGERLGWIGGQKAVLLSTPAIRKFTSLTEGKPFTLEIKNAA